MRKLFLILLTLAILCGTSCHNPIAPDFVIEPAYVEVQQNVQFCFKVFGGQGPYEWEVAEGSGYIDTSLDSVSRALGCYVSGSPGMFKILATSDEGQEATASGRVLPR